MKRLSVTFAFLLLFVFKLLAQDLCGTPAITNLDNLRKLESSQKRSTNSNYILMVYFHRISRSSGTGGINVFDVYGAYDRLNNDFNEHGIYFTWDGEIDYINDDIYFYCNPDTCETIFYKNNHTDGVDIYLFPAFPDNHSYTYIGRGHGVGMHSEFYIIGNNYYNPYCKTSTISHEMGHVLNLWHTHHGTVIEGDSTDIGYDANQCEELVDGSNSGSCGDYVEDTPADPNLNGKVNGNCVYTGTGTDSNNQAYNPDVDLIMSYAPISCRTRFSTKQSERMRDAIENLPFLIQTQYRTFSGPSTICPASSGTYTVNILPSGCTVVWSIDNNDFSITSSGNQCIVTYNATQQYAVVNLTATIKKNGTTITTFTKRIVMHGTDLIVYGEQDSYVSPNGTFPGTIPANSGSRTIPESIDREVFADKESLPINFIEDNTRNLVHPPIDLCGYGITEINGGNRVYLSSNRFDGMDISFSGIGCPTYFYHNGGYVSFEVPYNSIEYPVTLYAESETLCDNFCLTFNVVPLPGAVYGDDEIWVNLDGSMLYVTFMYGGEPIGNGQFYFPNYSVTISKIPGGTSVYSNTFPGTQTSFSVNTSAWTSGIYSIRIVCNGNIYSKSICL